MSGKNVAEPVCEAEVWYQTAENLKLTQLFAQLPCD